MTISSLPARALNQGKNNFQCKFIVSQCYEFTFQLKLIATKLLVKENSYPRFFRRALAITELIQLINVNF